MDKRAAPWKDIVEFEYLAVRQSKEEAGFLAPQLTHQALPMK